MPTEQNPPTSRILIITAPLDSSYQISREKKPILNDDGEVVGFERGKITIELPANVDINFLYN